MNAFSKLIPCAVGILMLTACSNENMPALPEEKEGDFYTAVAINFATGTRSKTDTNVDSDYTTSNNGTEIGKDFENKVNSVAIVLATTGNDPEVITYKQVGAEVNSGNASDENKHVYVAAFQSAELVAKAGTQFQTFVFCNPSNVLTRQLTAGAKLADLKYTLTSKDDNYAWTNDAFLMTNASLSDVKTLPTVEEFSNYNTEAEAFVLGQVNVERAAVRFDLKQGPANDTYTVGKDEKADPAASLVLTDVALFNMSKAFNYLRRVSIDGTDSRTDANEWSIGKPEQQWAFNGSNRVTGNYVVDTDFQYKKDYQYTFADRDNYLGHFFYDYISAIDENDVVTSDQKEFEWTPVSQIWSSSDDNDQPWNQSGEYNGYKIWRYATENTIPSVDQQKMGVSTGVYFRTKIVAADPNGALATAMKAGSWLYVFENKMMGTWAMVKAAADATPGTTIASAVATVEQRKAEGVGAGKILEGLGFTVYMPTKVGNEFVYYVGYAYKNRHNDNLDNKVMGPMEFATVRNNVYKLQLSDINMWGHPMNPGDPDPGPGGDP
ncbi:MAG: Mfa1 family fimbria major subunit, partial [Bacteroidales bacterium]|nr:Mfa1 family fimbria major subunit [Bacteroidales bacterium]